MDLTHTIYYPQEYVGECEHGYPLPYSFAFGIDLTENDICGRITFPFITAVDKTNATSNRIDQRAGEKKSVAKHLSRVPRTPGSVVVM